VSKSNSLENAFVAFIANATAMPSYGGDLVVSLHTADPGEGGTQQTNECAYTSYARVSVLRDASGWTVSGNQFSNTAEITFPECTGGSETATHFAIGTDTTGTGTVLYKGALTAGLAISNLITPRFPAGTLVVQED
jgi:hypothetical protein